MRNLRAIAARIQRRAHPPTDASRNLALGPGDRSSPSPPLPFRTNRGTNAIGFHNRRDGRPRRESFSSPLAMDGKDHMSDRAGDDLPEFQRALDSVPDS